jgi:hypothetical protein
MFQSARRFALSLAFLLVLGGLHAHPAGGAGPGTRPLSGTK